MLRSFALVPCRFGRVCLPEQTSGIIMPRRQRYDVDLVLTTFDGSLWETMRLMQSTDLFMGMHGAGFTNTLFLPKVRLSSTERWADCGCRAVVTAGWLACQVADGT